ncbi:hypothetical protein D9M72_342780 [compost metagenome]
MGAIGLDPIGIGQGAQGRGYGGRGELFLQFVQPPAPPQQGLELRLLSGVHAAGGQSLGTEHMGRVEQLGDAEVTATLGEQAEAHLPEAARAIAQTGRQARQIAKKGHLEFALAVLQQMEGAGEGGDLQLEVDVRQLRVQRAEQIRQWATAVRLGQPRHLGHRHSPLLGARDRMGPDQAQAEAEQQKSAHGTPGSERYA